VRIVRKAQQQLLFYPNAANKPSQKALDPQLSVADILSDIKASVGYFGILTRIDYDLL